MNAKPFSTASSRELLSFLMVSLLGVLGCTLGCTQAKTEQLTENQRHFKKNSPVFCHLEGGLAGKKQAHENHFSGLVRLNFPVHTIEGCREKVIQYCHSRRSEGRSLSGMRITFRSGPSSSPAQEFTVTSKCVIRPK